MQSVCPLQGHFPDERVMELTSLRYKAFVLTLVVAACKRGATRETRCRDKSMASPYNRVSGICMCLPLALKIFPSSRRLFYSFFFFLILREKMLRQKFDRS